MASPSRKRRKAILGKKLGMTQFFDEDGTQVPVTVLQAGPCTILQVKTEESDGYTAYQLGFDDRRREARKPQQAYLDRIGVAPKRFVREVPFIDEADVLAPEGAPAAEPAPAKEAPAEGADTEAADTEGADTEGADTEGADTEGADTEGADTEAAATDAVAESPGGEADSGKGGAGGAGGDAPKVRPGVRIGAGAFRDVPSVDVQGLTKGRGFTGTIKRYGHSRGDKSHGGKSYRRPGSTGQHTDPGRVFKGKPMPGQHGHQRRTIRNLRVVRLDEENHLLLVRGAVPGPNGGYVYIEESLS